MTDREVLFTRWGQLKTERSTWIPHWRELSNFLLPRSGRYYLQDRNKGQRRDSNILDNTGTRALRVLAAGMMSGMTSPARPWFKLGVADSDLAKVPAVKLWLNQTTILMRDTFARGNTYRALHTMYEELGAFGTAATILMPDDKEVIRHHTLTTGEYAISVNNKGTTDTLYREFQQTVRQVVAEFGLTNCSPSVRNMYAKGQLDQWITVIHAIEPRSDRDPSRLDGANMAWKSVYFELAGERGRFLRESGFPGFNVLAPRWATSGGDQYGNSPGMEALGDIKQLQQEQLRKSQGIDFMVRPPLQAPSALKNKDIDGLPGGVTFYDAAPNQGIKTMFDVRLDLSHLLVDIQDVRERIRASFYADLFLMLANQTETRMTATEVAERHEEKLLMLGPVLERLHNEMLDPLIDQTFAQLVRSGRVSPPPEELKGSDLNVEYVSMLAQAQQAVGTNSVDRFVGTLGQIAQIKPDVLDKFDADAWADAYSDMLGVDSNLVVPSDKVALIRKQRAQAAQQAQQAAQAQQQAATVKDLGSADPQNVQDVIGMFSGYSTPSAAPLPGA